MRCHREAILLRAARYGGQVRLRRSSGWNRLRRGYGGSSALLEYAVMHGDGAEAARLRAELMKLVEKV